MTMTLKLPETAMDELKKSAAQTGTSETYLVTRHLETWLSQSVADNEKVLDITQRIIDEDRKLLERLA